MLVCIQYLSIVKWGRYTHSKYLTRISSFRPSKQESMQKLIVNVTDYIVTFSNSGTTKVLCLCQYPQLVIISIFCKSAGAIPAPERSEIPSRSLIHCRQVLNQLQVCSRQRYWIFLVGLLFIYLSFCFDFPENHLIDFSFSINSFLFVSATVCLFLHLQM